MVAVATIFDLKVSIMNDAVTIFSVWGGVLREECPEQELRAEEGEVGADFENAGFMVQVRNRCHPEGAIGYSEG